MFPLLHRLPATLSKWWRTGGSIGGAILLAGLLLAIVLVWRYRKAMAILEHKTAKLSGQIEKLSADSKAPPDPPPDP